MTLSAIGPVSAEKPGTAPWLSGRPLHLIGVPSDLGGNRRGASMGPAAFRAAGIVDRLAVLGGVVTDDGDVAVPPAPRAGSEDPRKRCIEEIAAVGADVYRRAINALRGGGLPVVLGGDHSISAGSAAAAATFVRERSRQPIGLIWVDAHGDMNTPTTTLTGNVHGMPLAALLGDEPAELAGLGGWSRKVPAQHAVLLGVRSVDAAERAAIAAAGVHVFTMADIGRRGIDDVMAEALEYLTNGTGGIHVSLDLDACDPTQAPGVSTPVSDGLDPRDVHTAMRLIAATNAVVSLDLVEVNPICDVRNATAELGIELALSLLGRSAR